LGEKDLTAGAYIVVDIGKTLSKVTLWSKSGALLDRVVRNNVPQSAADYSALDISGIGAWLTESLTRFADHPVEAIIPVAHGAAVVALASEKLAFPPIDYEQPVPLRIAKAYAKQRDPFALTGSPLLPHGLNIGSQLYWLDAIHGDDFRRSTLLLWAQYWAWFLSGASHSEVTSLGCHSDLWCPAASDYAPMAKRYGWASMFAPLAKAGDVIGTIRPELAAKSGLSPRVNVHAGLHDSNAALLAARGYREIADDESTILSTGTWFVAMRSAKEQPDLLALPADRDCLINVDASGKPVMSARWMGGREIESQVGRDAHRIDIQHDQAALLSAVPAVLANNAMLLPGFAPGCGPFPKSKGQWSNRPAAWSERRAAVCLYAAMVTNVSLDLINANRAILVEGRFAEAQVFVQALAALRPKDAIYTANAHNDASFGALRLIDPSLRPQESLSRIKPLEGDLSAYQARWCALAGA
jgi:sugar (pentulose or hexulose) kinase